MGNIMEFNELEDILKNENFIKISNSVSIGINNCRNDCDYFKLCGGRSPAIKMYENNSFECTTTKHCLLHRQTLADTVVDELSKLSYLQISQLQTH